MLTTAEAALREKADSCFDYFRWQKCLSWCGVEALKRTLFMTVCLFIRFLNEVFIILFAALKLQTYSQTLYIVSGYNNK